MQETRGAVRADLVGGTLDLFPLNLQIPNVVTINMALSLEAKVEIEETNVDGIEIISKDYSNEYHYLASEFTKEKLYFSDHFGKMTFIAQILDHCKLTSNIKLTLSSGAPAGSGLGGSSSMGVTLFKAISKYKKIELDRISAINQVQQIEAGILMAGVAGYQDYYPALFGGVLALHPQIGSPRVEQLATDELRNELESNMTLVFSGVSRDSGINNWDVYKNFYDKTPAIIDGLTEIASISMKAYEALKAKDYLLFLSLVIDEGESRAALFPSILGEKIQAFKDEMLASKLITGIKICGAGGGGCFLVIHPNTSKKELEKRILDHDMKVLEFKVGEILK